MQCTWGRETAKKARTQQHFESLVNHIKSLEARVRELEGDLARTRAGSLSDAAPPSAAGSSSLSPQPQPSPVAVAKYEPDEDDRDQLLVDAADADDEGADQDSEIEQLIAPTRHLVVRAPLLLLLCRVCR